MGATGEIVATTFSRVFPMIRFATGDLSYLIKNRCPCGRTSPRFGKILGRTDQVTKVWGIFIHPWQVDEVMAKFSEVANYQIVVTRKEYRDEMTVYIELRKDAADQMDLRSRVEKEMEEVLKVKGQVEFIQRGGIPDRAKKIDDRRIWE
jgi:phenylacetate-CoA ligase